MKAAGIVLEIGEGVTSLAVGESRHARL